MLETEDAVEDDASFSRSTVAANTRESSKLIDTYNRDPLTGSLRFSEKIKMMELLDRWEEPERSDRHKVRQQISFDITSKTIRGRLTIVLRSWIFTE